MKCPLCAGDMEKGKTSLTFDKAPEETIVVRNIPAEVCVQCGEAFIDIQTTKKVEEVIKLAQNSGLKMGFLEFGSAA